MCPHAICYLPLKKLVRRSEFKGTLFDHLFELIAMPAQSLLNTCALSQFHLDLIVELSISNRVCRVICKCPQELPVSQGEMACDSTIHVEKTNHHTSHSNRNPHIGLDPAVLRSGMHPVLIAVHIRNDQRFARTQHFTKRCHISYIQTDGGNGSLGSKLLVPPPSKDPCRLSLEQHDVGCSLGHHPIHLL